MNWSLADLHTRLDRLEEQIEQDMNRERADAQRRMDSLRMLKASVNTLRVSLAMKRQEAGARTMTALIEQEAGGA